jgi:signal transduction histidine kinase/CheY-like chemotaxis protein
MSPDAPDFSAGPVLVLTPAGRDADLAAQLLAGAGIPCAVCASMDELCARIPEASAALIAEEAVGENALTTLTSCLAAQPPWSDLPIAVLRNPETELARPLRQLLSRANVTLLERPVRKVTLATTVNALLRARRRQHEVHDLVLQHEEAVRNRDRFLAILGHELRNPLGAILIATQRMERSKETAFRGELEVVHRQTRILSRLVDDLLDVARVTSGKIVLQKSAVNLREIARRIAASSVDRAGPRAAAVVLDAPDRPFVVDGDPIRLEQVLNNLVTNALKYTPPEGRVTISLAEEGDRVVLRVADNGVGIEPGMLERVFDLFAQAENSLDRAQGGMGIGLTLVRSLVELHGGTTRAESAGTGHGSTFTVSLPLLVSAVETTGAYGRRRNAASSRRVVVVEDNADLREQLVALLQDSGHVVECAVDGLSGVDRIAAVRPEIALVDIGLPGIDGYEVARRVRALLGRGVELVALTGYGQPDDRRRALEAGFDAHLTKPVTVSRLEELVENRQGSVNVPRRS